MKRKIEFYHSFKNVPGVGDIEGQWDLNPTTKHLQLPVEGKTLLDVGCRDGFYSYHFEKLGAKVTGLDMDDRMARRFMRKTLGSQVDFIHSNIYAMDKLPEKSYDVVFMGDVLCHLFDPVRALKLLHRVCRERIYLVADCWPTFDTWYIGYPFKFTEKTLSDVMGFAGFKNFEVLKSYQLKSRYWKERGSICERDVKLITAEPAVITDWRLWPDNHVIPYSEQLNTAHGLCYEVDFED